MYSSHESVTRHLSNALMQTTTLCFDFHMELHLDRYMGLPEDLKHF